MVEQILAKSEFPQRKVVSIMLYSFTTGPRKMADAP